MPENVTERRKRRVAVEKKIASLTKNDSRVTVVGTVISVDKASLIFTIEDPSGELTIISPNEEMISKAVTGSIVRVIGMVLPYEEGVELRAEIVQEFKINKELYPIIHKLMK